MSNFVGILSLEISSKCLVLLNLLLQLILVYNVFCMRKTSYTYIKLQNVFKTVYYMHFIIVLLLCLHVIMATCPSWQQTKLMHVCGNRQNHTCDVKNKVKEASRHVGIRKEKKGGEITHGCVTSQRGRSLTPSRSACPDRASTRRT